MVMVPPTSLTVMGKIAGVNTASLGGCLHSSKTQGTAKGEADKADRKKGRKTTSGNGQVWSSPSPRGQWRTGKNGGNWLRNHLWCRNDPRG